VIGRLLPVGGKRLHRPMCVIGGFRRPGCQNDFGPALATRRIMITASLAASLGPYLDPVALGIVGGGTVAAVILRTRLDDLGRAVMALPVLTRHRFSADLLLKQIAALGRIAQRHGVMALDRSVIADPDVAAAIAAVVDGAEPEIVTALVRYRRQARTERHLAAAEVWAGAAEVAPSIGMVGTLIGLVKMFLAMNDPSAIGVAMAVALLSTLYGAVIGSLIALPVAARLRRLAREEAFERMRLEAPLAALAAREVPRSLERAAA